jgi:hypothetical protein
MESHFKILVALLAGPLPALLGRLRTTRPLSVLYRTRRRSYQKLFFYNT